MLVVVARLASRVPLTLSQSLGSGLGRLLDFTNSKRRRVAETNIAACFPHLSPRKQRALRRQAMIQSARLIAELPAAWFRSRHYWAKRLDTSAFDPLAKELLAQGKGLILALPHLGNWELGINGFGAVGGVTSLYRPPRKPALESLMRKGRERDDVRMVPTDRGGLRAMCKELKDGRAVVILPDQAPPADQAGAVHAPFFGLPALTMTLLSQLARRTGAPVVFSYFERGPAGRFTLRCFEADSAIASKDPFEAATALNEGVERCVKLCPDQYQWTYRRFKRPPAGEASIYEQCRKNKPGTKPGDPYEPVGQAAGGQARMGSRRAIP
jgi:KDO2-lipid IV(A) lauroyltransferase